VGFFIVMVGVVIAKSAHYMPGGFLAHLLIDAVGYGVHGIGMIPFVANLEHAETETNVNNQH
jgi:hypothetical protein